MTKKIYFEKYKDKTLKEIIKEIESKSVKDFDADDLFLYEAITRGFKK